MCNQLCFQQIRFDLGEEKKVFFYLFFLLFPASRPIQIRNRCQSIQNLSEYIPNRLKSLSHFIRHMQIKRTRTHRIIKKKKTKRNTSYPLILEYPCVRVACAKSTFCVNRRSPNLQLKSDWKCYILSESHANACMHIFVYIYILYHISIFFLFVCFFVRLLRIGNDTGWRKGEPFLPFYVPSNRHQVDNSFFSILFGCPSNIQFAYTFAHRQSQFMC